jgi:hypothetical protein
MPRARAAVRSPGGVLLLLLVAACAVPVREPLPALPAAPLETLGDVVADVYLVGDAGAPLPGGDPVLRALEAMLAAAPERSLAVFLGDNLYPTGLVAEGRRGRARGERILDAQVDAVRRAGAHGLFVPGNHDWNFLGFERLERIRRQAAHIDARGDGRVEMLPKQGCPGPDVVDFGTAVRIVAIDTQWWIQGRSRPEGPGSPCAARSEQEVVDQLVPAVWEAGDRVVVVAAHHPMVSGGEHGGHFAARSYWFAPYPIARRAGLLDQDVSHPRYAHLIRSLRVAFEAAPPLVYAAGHEHSLQLLQGLGARYQVVSGTGSYGHLDHVRLLPSSLYARSASGFARLSVLRDGRVRLAMIVVDEHGAPHEDFATWLERGAVPPE